MTAKSNKTRVAGLTGREARAAEDPVEMTSDARMHRLARLIAEVLKANPDLTPDQAARAGRLKLKAQMARAAEKSAEARRARKTEGGTA